MRILTTWITASYHFTIFEAWNISPVGHVEFILWQYHGYQDVTYKSYFDNPMATYQIRRAFSSL